MWEIKICNVHRKVWGSLQLCHRQIRVSKVWWGKGEIFVRLGLMQAKKHNPRTKVARRFRRRVMRIFAGGTLKEDTNLLPLAEVRFSSQQGLHVIRCEINGRGLGWYMSWGGYEGLSCVEKKPTRAGKRDNGVKERLRCSEPGQTVQRWATVEINKSV